MKILKVLSALILTTGIMVSCSDSKTGESAPATGNDSISANAAIENIMTRASVRQFTDRQISKDTLDLIVKAGMAAPTAMNAQPWGFVIVNDKEVLKALEKDHPYSNLATATAAIVVCGDLSKIKEGENPEYWVQDCSAATENILLAAHAYGIGAVWCGVYPVEERIAPVVKTLGLPENIIPLNIITMGYPKDTPQPKDKFVPGNIHYNKW